MQAHRRFLILPLRRTALNNCRAAPAAKAAIRAWFNNKIADCLAHCRAPVWSSRSLKPDVRVELLVEAAASPRTPAGPPHPDPVAASRGLSPAAAPPTASAAGPHQVQERVSVGWVANLSARCRLSATRYRRDASDHVNVRVMDWSTQPFQACVHPSSVTVREPSASRLYADPRTSIRIS
jgi:hypothetical protein